jgi:hypothetical protein
LGSCDYRLAPPCLTAAAASVWNTDSCYVAEVGLELGDPAAFASQVLGL